MIYLYIYLCGILPVWFLLMILCIKVEGWTEKQEACPFGTLLVAVNWPLLVLYGIIWAMGGLFTFIFSKGSKA